MMEDQVFAIRQMGEQVFKVIVGGKIVAAEWPDKGAAQAGLKTEQRRTLKRTKTA